MTPMKRVQCWANFKVGGLHVIDAVAAVALSIYAVLLTSGTIHTGHPHGGIGASIGVLAMTVPVAWRRRAPVAAAAVLAAGGLLNGVLFGSIVRCGAALPAVFLVGFALGARRDQTRSAAGLVLCAANVTAQAAYDPQLGLSVIVLMLPLLGVFFALGRIVRSHAATVESLQRQSAELRRQREQTARLTTMADRERISEELDGILSDRIGRIATTAAVGREALEIDPAGAAEALFSIEHEGRDVLRQMREIVGALDEAAPNEPQPTLAELSTLLVRATTADARLTIEGSPRRLPAGLELSGYRIVEHLLLALEDAPAASIDVRLCFEPDAIELHVSGPPASDVELGAVLAAARERAALHHGTLDGRTEGALCHAMARLPLVSGRA